ncbi:hypothetical protein B0T14DRAFT_81821 [Immersiella caudata]|uniref:Uncharacterized protein n=1 Tax=Immersiella caudata TaxID=314043 RepID=A0AA39XGV8_9PEZI|nr:hypothetical protein B0T14DRAFT_81821 [Immersiella caudata]
MASFRGSSNPANLSPSRALRPILQQRAQSSSSEASCGSASPASEDQFVFSVGNTPSNEYPPSHSSAVSSGNRTGARTSAPREGLLFGKRTSIAAIAEISESLTSAQSKPIAIELPTARRAFLDPESAPADTPPEPLSARGDIPGGYFPLHEDPKSRVRRPHPFHLDASKAKHRSLNRAADSSKTTSQVPTVQEPPHFPFGTPPSSTMSGSQTPVSSTMSGSHTPVSSYIPIGVHDSAALPLGKYYPSNYERRPVGGSHSHLHSPTRAGVGLAAKSEPQVPLYRHDSATAHSRTNSEVKRRLVQYQRDMVAQAAMAASALLANNEASASSGTTPTSTLPGGVTLPSNVQLGRTIVKTHKPISPRLEPLGSPGPVTPMSLEVGSEGYMLLSRSTTSSHGDQAGAIHVEHARQRSEQQASPVAERGPLISV